MEIRTIPGARIFGQEKIEHGQTSHKNLPIHYNLQGEGVIFMKRVISALRTAIRTAAGKCVSIYKRKILFGGGLAYTQMRVHLPRTRWLPTWNYFDQLHGVAGGLLFLGAIPLKNNFNCILDTMGRETGNPAQKEFAFLSVLEPFETDAGTFYKPALPAPSGGSAALSHTMNQTGQKLLVHNLHLPVPDFHRVDLGTIRRGVEFIHRHVQKKIPVYSHCKAGRARSVIVMAAYLLLYQFEAVAASMGKQPALFSNPAMVRQRQAELKFNLVAEYMQEHRQQALFAPERNQVVMDFYLNLEER
jgi:hypothetical protein